MYKINFSNPIHIYFIGIGGISMSGLAEILLDRNFRISGSDMNCSPLTQALEKKGASIYYGQETSHLPSDVDLVVYTSAIQKDNPEFAAMLQRGLPSLSRAQLLGQIMQNYQTPIAISGTHGKTTTTSMLAQVLLESDSDPTLSIGGIFKPIGGNIRVGSSELFLTEACEYTNSFLSFFPKISVILNIEEDHMDFFHSLHEIRESFQKFAALLPKDGCLIINGDIENWEDIAQAAHCRVITYGSSPYLDYSFSQLTYDNLGHPTFQLKSPNTHPEDFSLRVPGLHNVSNALATIACGDLLNIHRETIKKALLCFHGTDRRFEYKGCCQGFTIIDDYAHHPTEITATLEAAKTYPHRRLWCVFQPHTYTRTKAFLKEFAQALTGADEILLTDIYAARETDTLNISSQDLQSEIQKLGKNCHYFPTFDEAEKFLLKNCTEDDLLITMGAGDVVKIGENLLAK